MRTSAQSRAYLRFSGRYFPVCIKFINKKAYIINDAGQYKTRGLVLTKVNGYTVNELMQKFMSYEPADGYNTTSKYRWIEENGKFSDYYARCYPPVSFFNIEAADPVTGQKKTFNNIAALSYDDFFKLYKATVSKIKGVAINRPNNI